MMTLSVNVIARRATPDAAIQKKTGWLRQPKGFLAMTEYCNIVIASEAKQSRKNKNWIAAPPSVARNDDKRKLKWI